MKDPHKIDYFRWRSPESIGPDESCRELALLVLYCPFLWRKVARFLNKLRRINRTDFTGENYRRAVEYSMRAMGDTKFPSVVEIMIRNAVEKEFGFDPLTGIKTK